MGGKGGKGVEKEKVDMGRNGWKRGGKGGIKEEKCKGNERKGKRGKRRK